MISSGGCVGLGGCSGIRFSEPVDGANKEVRILDKATYLVLQS